MAKLLFLVFLFVSAGLGLPAAAQTGTADVPPRPKPFHFVNDEASLMAPADAKKLESGLRRYADNNGTQVVVVTVPSLGGRDVADYARAIGTATDGQVVQVRTPAGAILSGVAKAGGLVEVVF